MSLIHNDLFSDFDRFFSPVVFRPSNYDIGQSRSHFRPSLDVKESDKGYQAQLNLPGLKKDQVDISLNNGRLSVSATNDTGEHEEDKNGWQVRERHYGQFSRTWSVPHNITHDDIYANLNDGVLTINYPKKESEAAKKITIN